MIDDEVDEALRALCDDVPPMEDRAFTAGRARLLAAIGSPTLAEPVAADQRAGMLALVPDPPRRSPPLRRMAPWLTAAAVVGAVAVGAVAMQPGGSGPAEIPAGSSGVGGFAGAAPLPTGPLPPMPAAPLNAAGDLAGKVTDPAPPAGRFRYVRHSRTHAASASSPGWEDTVEIWRPTGPGLATSTGVKTIWHDVTIGAVEEVGDSCPDAGGLRCNDGGPWAATPDKLDAFPRDPAALYERLRSQVNAGRPSTRPGR